MNVNIVTAAELRMWNRVGKKLSEQVVRSRQGRPFRDWEDFTARVKGFPRYIERSVKFPGILMVMVSLSGGSA